MAGELWTEPHPCFEVEPTPNPQDLRPYGVQSCGFRQRPAPSLLAIDFGAAEGNAFRKSTFISLTQSSMHQVQRPCGSWVLPCKTVWVIMRHCARGVLKWHVSTESCAFPVQTHTSSASDPDAQPPESEFFVGVLDRVIDGVMCLTKSFRFLRIASRPRCEPHRARISSSAMNAAARLQALLDMSKCCIEVVTVLANRGFRDWSGRNVVRQERLSLVGSGKHVRWFFSRARITFQPPSVTAQALSVMDQWYLHFRRCFTS